MKIATLNVNGIRSAIKKDLHSWITDQNIDILCMQEIKINETLANTEEISLSGYNSFWHSAKKDGYSGVACYSKQPPVSISKGIGNDLYDNEGRVLRLDFERFVLINVYIPSGSSGEHRHEFKMKFLPDFGEYIEKVKKENENIVVVGDYNIVHKDVDIHNPDRKDNPSGYRPEERKWLDDWFNNGFSDAFRLKYPQNRKFTWWSYRAGAFKKNLGWRIDYISVSDTLKDKVIDVEFFTQNMFSDHCPVIMDIDI
ncbi:MAG: exodeoxyribonuclease III [Deltaproteobacteria bacterium]